MKLTRLIRHGLHGPWGEEAKHLPAAELERGLAALSPGKDSGTLGLIVSRGDDGKRSTPERVALTTTSGIPGDAWSRDCPDNLDSQLAVMRLDVARMIANGQPLTLFGDNLLIDLDLSTENLPIGSRLRIGTATFVVTPEPHNGCMKFRKRFGVDALKLTADPRFKGMRLRGLYLKVVEAGEIGVGDGVEVLARA